MKAKKWKSIVLMFIHAENLYKKLNLMRQWSSQKNHKHLALNYEIIECKVKCQLKMKLHQNAGIAKTCFVTTEE